MRIGPTIPQQINPITDQGVGGTKKGGAPDMRVQEFLAKLSPEERDEFLSDMKTMSPMALSQKWDARAKELAGAQAQDTAPQETTNQISVDPRLVNRFV